LKPEETDAMEAMIAGNMARIETPKIEAPPPMIEDDAPLPEPVKPKQNPFKKIKNVKVRPPFVMLYGPLGRQLDIRVMLSWIFPKEKGRAGRPGCHLSKWASTQSFHAAIASSFVDPHDIASHRSQLTANPRPIHAGRKSSLGLSHSGHGVLISVINMPSISRTPGRRHLTLIFGLKPYKNGRYRRIWRRKNAGFHPPNGSTRSPHNAG